VTLDARTLGRATLARQHLLERAPAAVGVVDLIERVGGLQAQEPASPAIALWTRRHAFAADELATAIMARDIVKGTLMRTTLHAVSGADHRRLRPAVAPSSSGIRRQDRRDPPDDATLHRLLVATAACTSEPCSLGELRDTLASLWPERDPAEVLWWARRSAPLVHAPDPSVPWSYGRRPRLVDATAWLGAAAPVALADSLEHLVRRYLGAFGPGTVADLAAWSGVVVATLRPAIAALEARDALWHGRDERGRSLLDLVDGPRPDADHPAPPRLLPMWDSLLLAHADRTRIIDDADRSVVIARNGDTLATCLVDGRVAGLWWAEAGAGGRTHIAIEPFRPIPAAAMTALRDEADALAAFVEPHEPLVYRRYRRWRPAA
jgi:hypothetical protein